MTKGAIETIACAICGTELTLAQLFSNEDTRLAVERLATVSIPLGARVLAYVTLFAPPKTRLTTSKQVKLILQLLPDLERQAITFKGREWAAPLPAWSLAIDQMMTARDAEKLQLPMSGHAYLYAILAGMADRHEGAAERQREEERRTGPRAPTTAGFQAASTLAAPPLPPGPAAPPPTSLHVRKLREELARKGEGKDGQE